MIYLARHGQTEYNVKQLLNGQFDDPLTKTGKLEAVELANKCYGFEIVAIYSSQLIRSFVTARIVADILGIKEIKALKDLNERNFGGMTHQPVGKIVELSDDHLRVNENSVFFLSGRCSETFPELIRRVSWVYRDITKKHFGENVLVVSHGDVMKAFEAIHRKVDFRDVLVEGHYHNCQVVPLG